MPRWVMEHSSAYVCHRADPEEWALPGVRGRGLDIYLPGCGLCMAGWVSRDCGVGSWGVVAFLAGSGVGVLRRGGSLCAIGAGQHDTFTSCGLTPLRAILRKVHRSHQTWGMQNGNHIPRSWIGPVADPNLHDNTARNSRPTPGQDLDDPLNQTVRYSDWSHSLEP